MKADSPFAILAEMDENSEQPLSSGENLPYLFSLDQKILERFAFQISISFINKELPESLDFYINETLTKDVSHKKKDPERSPLFRDVPLV